MEWASVKKRRVIYIRYGPDILARTDADDRHFNLNMAIQLVSHVKRYFNPQVIYNTFNALVRRTYFHVLHLGKAMYL